MFPSRDRSAARRFAAACALAAATTAVAAPTAGATNNSSKPVTWTLSFVDSVALTPSDLKPDRATFERSGGQGLTGAERPLARVLRNGSPIASEDGGNSDGYGGVSLPELLPGDVLQVLDGVNGGLYAQATFDGKPSFDATTCVGATKATGQRTADASVTEVGEYANVKNPWKYQSDPNMVMTGLLTNAAPGTFEATFKRPLIAGHVLYADTTLLQGPSVTVTSHTERLVGQCPPPPIPPDTLPPAGAASAPAKAKKLKDITKKGVTYQVNSAEAATVNATLTLITTNGKKGKKKKVKTLVVGHTTTSVAAGGSVTVTVMIDKSLKGKVVSASTKKGSKLILSTTLTDAAGNTSTLPDTPVKFPKA